MNEWQRRRRCGSRKGSRINMTNERENFFISRFVGGPFKSDLRLFLQRIEIGRTSEWRRMEICNLRREWPGDNAWTETPVNHHRGKEKHLFEPKLSIEEAKSEQH